MKTMPTLLIYTALVIACLGLTAQSANAQESAIEKIKQALSAGPPNVANEATVAEINSDGGMKILREGTNDFTCMPGDPTGTGIPAMCADKVAMQWNSDFAHHKARPSTTVPGIEYMLAGATQRSDSDPFDKTSPPIPIGPHWMILGLSIRRRRDCLPCTSRPGHTSCGPAHRGHMFTSWGLHKAR